MISVGYVKHIAAFVLAFAVAAFPLAAHAQNAIAYRLGPGAQMTCVSGVPTHISTRGTVWCKSTDSNKLHYTDPSGTDIALGAGGGGSGSVGINGAYANAATNLDNIVALSSSFGPLVLQDASTPLGVPLLQVTNHAGTSTYFSVSAASTGAAVLDFIDGASASLSASGHGTLIYDNTLHVFRASLNGGAYATLGGGGASFPLTNGTSSWTANYAGTNTGSSVDYVFDATNAAVAGDKHFSFRTGTTEFMSLKQSFTGIWDFVSSNGNIGLLNSTGDGIRAQGANTVYIYGIGAPQVEILANNGIFPFNNNSIYSGTVDNSWKWTASNWEAAPLGASIASASTVTPTSSAHPLTGTTTVNTIATTNIPTGTATVSTTETFICAAACVFGTGGNISVGLTGVAGSSYTFTWDGTAWRPPGTLAGAVTASTLTSGTLPVATGGSTLANSGFTASGGTFDLASAGTATLFGTTATNIQIGHTAVQTKISGAFALGTQAATMTATTSVTTSSGPVAKLTYASATNVTSMTLTAPGIDGQEMTVMLIQPASGTAATMTTTWTNVNFAGTAVFTATLGKRDVYTFAFDATTSKWYERSRSLNLAN